jgi:hypothetical protein
MPASCARAPAAAAAATHPRCFRRRCRAAASAPRCAASTAADDAAADATFQALARAAGVVSPKGPPALCLRTGPFGRGLFAARDLSPGEPLLSVPLPLCLIAERTDAVSVPGAPWASLVAERSPGWPRLQTSWEEYPLPWDARLALCLLDALDGGAGAPESDAARMWQSYGALLPRPSDVSNPVALPASALAAAQAEALQADWAADAARLAAMCPALGAAPSDTSVGGASAPSSSDSAAADVLPSPLHYGVALARSRAFGAGDVFLICPFVDMANTTFAAAPAGANAVAALRLPPGVDAAGALLAAQGSFDLSVSPSGAGIAAGSEVLISYGAGTSTNASLLARYGFVRDANPNERAVLLAPPAAAAGAGADGVDGSVSEAPPEPRPAPEIDVAALERAASDACAAAGGRWMRERSTDGQLIAALGSLPARSRAARPRRAEEERADVEALRSGVAAALDEAPTTLEARVLAFTHACAVAFCI